jgi:Ca-activated chloride channel family protein
VPSKSLPAAVATDAAPQSHVAPSQTTGAEATVVPTTEVKPETSMASEAVPPPVVTTKPVEPAKPVELAKPVEPEKPVVPVQPVMPALSTSSPERRPAAADREPAGRPEIEVLFTYGSEKQKWIDEVTATFNATGHTLKSGEKVRIKPVPVGSGELIDEVLTQRRKAHLVSPAAAAFIVRGNSDSRERGQGDLVGPTIDLVSSPVVVAMWREIAEAIGWPGKNLRWRDIFEYARDESRWKQVAKPEWGNFKLAHTLSDSSNSGLHALLLEAYAATGKFEGFSRIDAGRPEVPAFIRDIEKAVPYYESSTGFLARRMIREGRSALSAAIVYENLVLEANAEAIRKDPSIMLPVLVAIYPAEGTFPTEHPVGIVERPWVTDKHREAANVYVDFLRDRPQQEKALRYGFRPQSQNPDIDVTSVLKPEFGVNDKQPTKTLHPPQAAAIRLLLETWRTERNPIVPATSSH